MTTSAHVLDRLPPYLDRELPPREAEAVEAHLRGCEACRRRLETLAAVDAAARALPAGAPPGYFDALPGRIRARIESSGRTPGAEPVPLRLPAWTWAAAAAFLLAVVTPLTMMRGREASRPDREAPAVPATPGVPPSTRAQVEPSYARAADARAEHAGGKAAAEEAQPEARSRAKREIPAPRPPVETKAPVGRGAAHEGPPASADAESLSLPATEAPALAAAPPPAQALAAEAEPAMTREEAAPPVTRPMAKGARERDALAARRDVALSDAAPADEAEYRRLIAFPAETVEALRARREAWRAFAERFPRSRHADEARVRVVEEGAAAWRLGRDPRDLARAREDAAAYLDRVDAARAARVRTVLADLEER